MSLLRVLICDFDFFSTVGGGQVFYRRVIERNPDLTFFYPSRARDFDLKAEGRLPGNAHPFLIGATAIDEKLSALGRSVHPVARVYVDSLAAVAASVQGEAFDVVDIPSFFPAAHLVRPVFACFGITAVRVVLSMLGWNSVSCRSSYQDISQIAADLEIEEIACANAADVRYTISPLEQRLHTRGTLPVQQVDMHDFLEEFPLPDALPPGSGPPDLWYVGRLDGAKGPDIFVDLAARLPRCLYRRCYLTGPDNLGHAEARWSAHVLNLARRHGVDASYLGLLSDADVRLGAYQGRSVVVVPSRSDSFNFVALEAVLSGCPVLLSSRTGASEFLAKQHPTLVPPIMNPDDLDDAARKLRGLLEEYQGEASRLRQALRSNPFPPPRINGMAEIYGLAVSARQPVQTRSVVLVIGMAESIHVARWMSMVALSPALKFVLCPVFRPGVEKNRINPDFRATRIVRSAEEIADILPGEIGLFDVDSVAPDDLTAARRATGFKPYHPSFLPSKWKFTEPGHIAAAITRLRPALVISLEVQFAGYLALAAKDYLGAGFPRWLLSNWGSDIYLYRKLKAHEPKLRRIAQSIDAYVAECERDVAIVRQMGFRGPVLPTMPASGGVDFSEFPMLDELPPPSSRREIHIKGYHGWSGRALHILAAVHMAAAALSRFAIRISLAGPEVEAMASLMAERDGLDIACEPYVASHAESIERLARARLSVGMGISDGISTTLLESMAVGTFPIKGNSSCACEWVENGRTGMVLSPHDTRALAEALALAASDDALVDGAAAINRATVERRWDAAKNRRAIERHLLELAS